VGARETSIFAIHTVRVEGVAPALAHRVETALQPLEGTSLLKLKADDVSRLATALPDVASVSYDRAFPNTLRVRVEPEQPLAVLRRGPESWLVSRRGRVTQKIPQGAFVGLPRVWIPHSVEVALGGTIGAGDGAAELAALVPVRAAGLSARVLTVQIAAGQVTYALRGGLELRAGSADNLPLKLAVAREILRNESLSGYLDVSVPERPVGGSNPQVSSTG
jgi:cell division septal protein FtsQ